MLDLDFGFQARSPEIFGHRRLVTGSLQPSGALVQTPSSRRALIIIAHPPKRPPFIETASTPSGSSQAFRRHRTQRPQRRPGPHSFSVVSPCFLAVQVTGLRDVHVPAILLGR